MPKMISALFSLPLTGLRLLVVDDNSPDGTGDLVEQLSPQYDNRIRVLHRAGKQGLGTAYIQGFRLALEDGAEAVAQMDADFSHPPEKLVEMEQVLKACSVAVGSRYVPGGRLDERWPVWRKALSGFGNLYARIILDLPMQDVTGGYRMWRRETLLGMPLERVRSSGYIFQVEMAYLAHRLGYTFAEIPIFFAERRLGASKMSIRIQVEAATRVWLLRGMYRDIKKVHPGS